MLSYLTLDLISYSICLAALIGLVRLRKIAKPYYPFLYFVWLALSCEIISSMLIVAEKDNIAVTNVYVLLESILILWLFKNWAGGKNRKIFNILGCLLILVWVCDNLVFHTINRLNSIYRVVYSFVIVFYSIDQINKLMLQERKNILRNSRFLICFSFVIFYTYKAAFEVFYIVQLPLSNYFYKNLWLIMVYVNLFANLLYAIAALWIPTRQKFSLPF